MLDKVLLGQPITGQNLEKEVAYFEPEFIQNRCRTSLNGMWQFVFADDFENYLLDPNLDISLFNSIKVPSHIEMNGYDKPKYCNMQYPWDGLEDVKLGEVPKHNKVGVYFKDIEINLENKDYFIEFEGFESALYLFVNGKYVGYSTKNYTTSTFKLNEYLQNGKNRIVVVIYKYSFISWFSDQDMWRFFGIHRDVNLVVRNKFHIVDLKNSAVLQRNLKDGLVKFDFEFSNFDKNLKLELSLKYKNTVIKKRIHDINKKHFSIEFEIKDCHQWSDENPNLYTLEVYLKHNQIECESIKTDFGFKRVEIIDGTIYLNGKRFIIKGVNRHEFDARYGRALPKESIEEDLINIKKHNFNAIRTSHYPNNNYFYKRCSELGILVMDETAIETHGTWGHLNLKENQEFNCLPGSLEIYKDVTVERGLSMYERDKNHTCIFSWSLGNESYGGTNLEALYNSLKERDETRFIHYEGVVHISKYSHITDIRSEMYTKPENIRKYLKDKKNLNKPYMLCEFSHSMGNSTGNFDEYMALVDEFSNYNGGFIWDYMDQALLLEGNYMYGGDFREFPHDGNFCANGLVLGDKTNTSKITTVKYHYQSLKFDITKKGIVVTNNYNFINTEKFKFNYKIFKDEVIIKEKDFYFDLEPKKSQTYEFKERIDFEKGSRYFVRVTACNDEGHEIAFEEKFIFGEIDKVSYEIKDDDNKLTVYKSYSHLTVENKNIKVIFGGIAVDRGGLEAIYVGGKNYLNNIVLPTLFRPTIDNEAILYKYFNSFYFGASKYPLYNPFKNEIKVISQNDKKVTVEVIYKMITGIFFKPFKIRYTIFNSGEILVKFSYKPSLFMPKPPLIGIKFKLDKIYDDFEYIALGKQENYIDRFKGHKYGKYSSKASEEFVPYSTPQECGNHLFTKEINIKVDDKNLSISAYSNTFSFKYLPYDEFEMENASRVTDLPPSKFNYLTIHAANKGVGGDDSWGAPIHKQYQLKHKTYTQSFILKIK